MNITILRNIEDFQNLHDKWDELLESSSTESCFVSWEWLYTWMEIYGSSITEQCLIVVEKDDELIGIAPFYVQTAGNESSKGKRVLRFVGTGESEDDEVCSYYLDIVARKGFEEIVAESVWVELNGDSINWDNAIFPDLLEQSVMMQHILPKIEKSKFSIAVENDGIRFCIDLPDSMDEYISTLSKKRRKNIRLNTNRIEKQEKIIESSAETLDDALEAFEVLKKLHEVRWNKQGEKGAFASKLFTAFHRKIMKRLIDKGWLEIRLLKMQDEPISALYNIKYKHTVFTYQSGFNTPDSLNCSPGLYHDLVAIKDCIESSHPHYDYLKGQGQSYKSSLRSTESNMYTMIIYKNKASYLLNKTKKIIKEGLEKIRKKFSDN